MPTATTTRTCSFEQPYRDFDGSSAFAPCSAEATWVIWFPKDESDPYAPECGTTIEVCGDHLIIVQAGEPQSETVQISSLPMTCAACRAPVWAKHYEEHASVTADECEFCHGLAERRAADGDRHPDRDRARCLLLPRVRRDARRDGRERVMKATVKDLILGNAAITARIQAVLPDVSNDTNAAFVAVVLGDDLLLNLIGRVASDLDFADQQITELAVRIGQRMGDTKSSVERGARG